MKKNRPGRIISVICAANEQGAFTEFLIRHAANLGVKVFFLEKAMPGQGVASVATPPGKVRGKQTLLGCNGLRSKPEFEDCRALARSRGISLAEAPAAVGNAAGKRPAYVGVEA